MTAQPRLRHYRGEVRARMLVQAGLPHLAQGGITAVSVDNICACAGASGGLIAHDVGFGLIGRIA